MKKINIKDIARIANVSRGTVDRALHKRGNISEETRKRILQIASERNYKPNPAARMLVMGRAPLSIGVCIPRELRLFFDQVRDGIMEGAHRFESMGIKAHYSPFERYGQGEHERIQEMLNSNIKALIIAPGVDPRLSALIETAAQRKIHVVCVAGDVEGSLRSTAVCSDPEMNGRCAAELMAKFVRPGARIVVFTGMLEHPVHAKEVNSFTETFEQLSDEGKVIEVIENHESEEEALEKCSALLKRVRRIDGMYISTVNCLPVCAALNAAGRADKVKLVTTDLFPEMVPWFERGTIMASVYQRPYMQGQAAISLVADHLFGGHPFPPTCYLNPLIVLRSNLRMFREISPQDFNKELNLN